MQQKSSSLMFSLVCIVGMIFWVSTLMFSPTKIQADISSSVLQESRISEYEFERIVREYLKNNPDILKTPENVGLIFGE